MASSSKVMGVAPPRASYRRPGHAGLVRHHGQPLATCQGSCRSPLTAGRVEPNVAWSAHGRSYYEHRRTAAGQITTPRCSMVDADAPTGAGPGKLTTLSEAVAAHIHDGDCV